MSGAIEDALDAVSQGYSVDRIVADPTMNSHFIDACRARGIPGTAAELNRRLLNLRKRGGLAGRTRARRTSFADEGDYRFAAEIAVRFIERRDGVSLDMIICNPDVALEFDKMASSIAPGYLPLQYRWAALNLRKARRLKPELLARVAPPTKIINLPVEQIVVADLPTAQGLYLFIASDELLYVGEASNLRTRMKKHLDHSDNKGLARWIWEFGTEDLHLELQVLEEHTQPRVRKALELELIRSREPIFNVQR